MSNCATNRWPTIYDFDSLQKEISCLLGRGLDEGFYNTSPDTENLFQGDILEIDLEFPFIDEDGDISSFTSSKWLLLGNTCDITREDLPYTNLIPLEELENDIPEGILASLKQYQNYKRVYLPDITKKSNGYIADFTQICSIKKDFLIENAQKVSELEYASWVLFHSCIVRYFARDDGRKD
ncbi:MAG TPA: hypothetical protein ENK67_02995 [Flavobacteriia bacterium]|nr:hypothetical protein [Flavobacteriia bacterium]